jgi:hypothetical protein
MTDVLNVSHIWSKDALHNKAIRYIELMLSVEKNDWQFGFWSSLALEMIAKAAMSNISPVLIADEKDWNSIYYALGKNPVAKKFSPKSVDVSQILNRLESLLPEFTNEMNSFCILHMNRRNSELHSGGLAFDELGISEWLPKYYDAVSVLLSSYNESLQSTFGDDEAETAKTLIESYKDETGKSVHQTINAHKTVWDNKPVTEKELLKKQAEISSTRQRGHRVNCPSCDCVALLHGSAIGKPSSKIEDNLIVEKQDMLPSSFECIACGLKISGYSKLNVCGLGNTFIETIHYEPTEYFNIDPSSFFEEDFNEF